MAGQITRTRNPSNRFSLSRKRKARWAAISLAAGAVSLTLSGKASATTTNYNQGAGTADWNNIGHWDNGIPSTGQTVNIVNGDALARTVTYDYPTLTTTLGQLSIFNSGNTNSLSMTTAGLVLTVSGAEYVGGNTIGTGIGSVNLAAGTNQVGGFLDLGYNATDRGLYTIGTAGTLTMYNSATEYIGVFGGTGTITQNGGLNNVTGSSTIQLGYSGVNAQGFYNLTAGTLNAIGAGAAVNEFVGLNGTGTFVQSGGLNEYNNAVQIGDNSGSYGSYTLSQNGTLTTTTGALDLGVNAGSTGTFVQSGGLNNFNGVTALIVGASGSGSYTLSAGTVSATATATEYIGFNTSAGTFVQSNGANNINGATMFVGYLGTAIGNYNLNGGSINALSSTEQIGYFGTGVFTQTNGTNFLNFNSALILGVLANSTGSYSLQGGTLTVTIGNEYIGATGAATFTQTGGINTLSNNNAAIYLGYAAGSTGSYSLSQTGTLSSAGTEYIGGTGAGIFTQTGGLNSITNSTSPMYLGAYTGGTGSYSLQGGTLSTSGAEYVGFSGSGSFVQTGGINNITPSGFSTLILSNAIGITGSYSLQAGTLANGGSEFIGNNGGFGLFNQSGGLHTLSGSGGMSIGGSGIGTYLLSSGTLTVTAGGETLGDANGGGLGTFNQSGGINNISGAVSGLPGVGLEIGELQSAFSVGQYILTGGTLNLLAGQGEDIGDDGNATFIQNGGLNSVSGSVLVGSANQGGAGNSSSYTMYNGTLTVAGAESIGSGTFGSFTQQGGMNSVNGNMGLTIGGNNYTAFYTQNSGTLAASNILVTYGGTLNLNSGLVNCSSGTLTSIPSTSAGLINGQVYLEGSTLEVSALNFNLHPENFHWSSGELEVTQNLAFDSGSANTTSQAFGNSLTLTTGMSMGFPFGMTLMVLGNETIGGTSAFTLALDAGGSDTATGILSTAANGTFIQNGGAINQSLTNQGTFTYNGGVFAGQLINQGQANLNTSFNATGINNSGVIAPIPLGTTITLSSTGLTNSGLMTLTGGAIVTGAGGINNSSLITGHGSLSGNMIINSGTIDIDAGLALQVSGTTFTNDGVINLNGGNLTGAIALTNNVDGEIMGGGTIAVTSFTNNGTLLIPNGTTHIGSFTNNGVIELAGAGGNLGPSGTINNMAMIEGFGKISSAVVNNGEIQPTGGTMLITGALTNPSLIAIGQGDELLATNFASNAGVISMTGGTFDSANNPITNNGQVTGYGVLRSGGFTNAAAMTFTGGTTTVNGAFQNNLLGTVSFKYQPTIFTGNVTNNGLFKTTGTTVTFAGTFTGSVTSDPSTNIFQNNVTTNAGNAITGGAGDQFFMLGGTFNNGGSFINGGLLSSSNPINNSGVFTQTGSLTQSANMTNSGTATIGGAQNWSNGVVYANSAGKSTFLSDSGSQSTSPLNFNVTGGTVAFNASQHVSSVAVSGGGVIDVTNTTLRVNYGSPANDPVASIVGYLSSGYKGGAWTGNGINSSTAAAGSGNPALSVGYADGNTDGGTAAGANQVVVKYTLAGDSNLDGLVNFNDLVAVVQNFNKSGTDWAHGNFAYSATTNFNDLVAVVQNFNKTLNPAGSSDVASGGNTIALSGSTSLTAGASAQIQSTSVQLPEPGCLSLIGLGAGTLLARRRRKS